MILDTLAGSQFGYDTGTAATVTVPAKCFVTGIAAHASGANATMTITAGGPNQGASIGGGGAIPIPVGSGFSPPMMLGQLGPGTVIVFTGTDSYFVSYARFVAGGP